jgi:hypothetical protein
MLTAMLRDLNDRIIDEVHDPAEFQRLCVRLELAELEAINAALRDELDKIGVGSVISAGWIPGPNWNGGPFQPIYDKIFPGAYEQSGMFFGHLMKQAVIDHPGDWRMSKKPKRADDPNGIQITMYWRER